MTTTRPTITRIAAALAVAGALALGGAAPAAAETFPNGMTYCGGLGADQFPGVSAGKRTSCQFARSVARKYVALDLPAHATVRAYSRASDRTIRMRCRWVEPADSSPHGLCTGGRGARVVVGS